MTNTQLLQRLVSSLGITTGVGCAIGLVVLALKLTNVVAMSWTVALLPFYGTFGLVFVAAVVLAIVAYIKSE